MPRKPPPVRLTRLKFAPWEYNPQALQNRTEKELRQEYSRLRSIANKRLNRLMDSEFRDSQAVAYNAGLYIPLAGVESDSMLRHLLTDVAKFILSEQSTVSGQKAIVDRLVKTWHDDKGYDFINKSNVRGWVKFLDYVSSVEGYVYDTASAAEAFEKMGGDYKAYNDMKEIRRIYDYYVAKTSR